MIECKHTRRTVKDSRPKGGKKEDADQFQYFKYRRNECLDCGERFTTYELTVEQIATANLRMTGGFYKTLLAIKSIINEAAL